MDEEKKLGYPQNAMQNDLGEAETASEKEEKSAKMSTMKLVYAGPGMFFKRKKEEEPAFLDVYAGPEMDREDEPVMAAVYMGPPMPAGGEMGMLASIDRVQRAQESAVNVPKAVKKFCPNCGAVLLPPGKFCSECGEKVESEDK